MTKRSVALAISLVFLAAVAPAAEPASSSAPGKAKRFGTWGIDLEGMDRSVKPGDDFFRYVNGKWAATTQIPPDKTSYGAFAMLRDLSEARVRAHPRRLGGGQEPEGRLGRGEGRGDLSHLPRRSDRGEARREADPAAPRRGEEGGDARRRRGAHGPRRRSASAARSSARGVSDDAKNPDKYALYVSQSGLGLADREYYLRDNFKPQKERYQTVRRRHAAPRRLGRAGEERRRHRRDGDEDRRGALDARREPRPRQDLQPDDARRAGEERARLPLAASASRKRALDKADRAVVRQNTAVPEDRDDLRRHAGRDAEGVAGVPHRRRRGAASLEALRRHALGVPLEVPERRAGAAPALEARRRRRRRTRWARRSAAPTSPSTSRPSRRRRWRSSSPTCARR